jgi:hypothetical protein
MIGPDSQRISRVRAFVDAVATSLPMRDEAFLEALATESALSVEGVRLAIDVALETNASDEEIAAMVARAPRHASVGVVLSSNVFTAPFRAIAWALASAPIVRVRSSRRSRLFPRAIIECLRGTTIEACVALDESDEPSAAIEALAGEVRAVHAYGGAEALAAIEAACDGRCAVELHGPGFGIVIASSEVIVAHADAIWRDVVVFDQRGCLSPRVVFALGANVGADVVARALLDAGASIARDAPAAPIDARDAASIALALDLAAMSGDVIRAAHGVVATIDAAATEKLVLLPARRMLVVYAAADLAAVIARLGGAAALVTCVATEGALSSEVTTAFRLARVCSFGRMQRPPFDGPVDLRPPAPPT